MSITALVTGKLIATYPTAGDALTVAAFSADGQRVAVAGLDGTTRLYPGNLDGFVAQGCALFQNTPEASGLAPLCASARFGERASAERPPDPPDAGAGVE